MIKIYGNKMSNNTNKVLYTAGLLEIEYEFQLMDFQKDLKTPEFLKINPVGKIPALVDGSFTLFESGAISRYLCDKHKSSLYPKDIQKRALVDQWIDFSNIHIGINMSKVAWNRAWAPKMGLPADERSIKDGEKFLSQFLPIVDKQLSKNKYISGHDLTLADVSLLVALDYAEPGKVDLGGYKNVIKWREALQKEEFYTSVGFHASLK